MKYIIGLDIGIASVGWAVLKIDQNGNPFRIAKLGVRTFDPAENVQDGSSLAVDRRMSRGTRRRLRRLASRVLKMRSYISDIFSMSNFDEKQRQEDMKNINIYELRYKGINEKLTEKEIYYVLSYFAKHRGFKSNRKSELSEKGETGKLLKAINENKCYMTDRGYKTVGEMIYKDERFFKIENGKRNYFVRNHGDYKNCFLRKDLEEEIKIILENQQKYYQNVISQEKIKDIIEIFNSQRSFDDGPNSPSQYRANFKVGKCTFYKDKKRAPKGSFSFEYFDALCKINNLTYINENAEKYFLTLEQKRAVVEKLLKKSKISYKEVKKICNLSEKTSFSSLSYKNKENEIDYDSTEKALLYDMKRTSKIAKALEVEISTENADLLDAVSYVLSMRKSDEKRIDVFTFNGKDNLLTLKEINENKIKALTNFKFDNERLNKILAVNVEKFCNLSFDALEKLIPELEKGFTYDKACKNVGFDFNSVIGIKYKKLKYENLREDIEENITSPVVLRSVSQTIKVINAIIDLYGSPTAIHIELGRDMALNFNERRKIEKRQEENKINNEKIVQRLKELGITSPKGQDIIKLKLYDEQMGKCVYSGKSFESQLGDVTKIFENNNTQIDHIIPYSKCYDDSLSNKVLVLSEENQRKGNRLPYEYMTQSQWNDFEAIVETLYSRNIKKKNKLLTKHISSEEYKELNSRALNDTKHASKFIHNMLIKHLLFEENSKIKNKVRCVNGNMTSYLRKIWGLTKQRFESDIHHAQDAVVVACCSPTMINKITRYEQIKSYKNSEAIKRRIIQQGDIYIDKENSEKLDISDFGKFIKEVEKEYDEKHWDKNLITVPYDNFIKELKLRYTTNEIEDYKLLELQKLGYDECDINAVEPIFISRMPTRKMLGAIHKDTIRSGKNYNDKNKQEHYVLTKTPLTSLKFEQTVDNNQIVYNIKNYPEESKISDPKLYQAIIDRMLLYKGEEEFTEELGKNIAKKAFIEPLQKPNKNGEGHTIKTIKLEKKISDGIMLKNGGIAEKSSIVRIDVYEKDFKFYIIPIYVSDVYKQVLPNKFITSGKKYEDWLDLTDDYTFKFSLCPNDLIYLEAKEKTYFSIEDCKKKEIDKTAIKINKGYFYYNTINISNAVIKFYNNDRSVLFSTSFTNMKQFMKFQVDVLGKYNLVKQSKRQNLQLRKISRILLCHL